MANTRYIPVPPFIPVPSSYHTGTVPFTTLHERIKRGDIVGVRGHPARSKTGELSIVPLDVTLLTPCMHMLPHTHFGLKNQETR